MSAQHVYVDGVLTEVITYKELWRDQSVIYDESPWRPGYQVIVSIECANNGNGQCDGFCEDGNSCDCPCHTINWGNVTVRDIERFHENMWKGQPDDYEHFYEEFTGNCY